MSQRMKQFINFVSKNTLQRTSHTLTIYLMAVFFAINTVASLALLLSDLKQIPTKRILYLAMNVGSLIIVMASIFLIKYSTTYYSTVKEVSGVITLIIEIISATEVNLKIEQNSNIFLLIYASMACLGVIIFYETAPNFFKAIIYQLFILCYFMHGTFKRRIGVMVMLKSQEIQLYLYMMLIPLGATILMMKMRYENYFHDLMMKKTIQGWKKVMNISGLGISIEGDSKILYRNDCIYSLLPNLKLQTFDEWNRVHGYLCTDKEDNINYQKFNSYFQNTLSQVYIVKDISHVKKEQRDKYMQLLIATITHELRTPLNIIMAILGFIKDQTLDIHIKEEISKAQSASEMQENLINDILDVAKLNNGEFKLNLLPTDLRNTLSNLYELFKFKICKLIDFELIISPTVPKMLIIDERRYKQIVLNLLSNSAKFTSHGFIRLKVAFQEPYLVTSVADSGIGIAKKDEGKIFQQFGMIESNIQNNLSGSGLGLSLCKNLVEKMDGVIDFVSNESNTEFKFKIKAGIVYNAEIVKKGVLLKVSKILVVDDNIMNIYILQNFAKKKGIDCVSFQDPEEALSKINEIGLEFVGFLDINMPKMSGYELASKLKSKTDRARLIAVTGEDKDKINEKCLLSGFTSVIEKPISYEVFCHAISGE